MHYLEEIRYERIWFWYQNMFLINTSFMPNHGPIHSSYRQTSWTWSLSFSFGILGTMYVVHICRCGSSWLIFINGLKFHWVVDMHLNIFGTAADMCHMTRHIYLWFGVNTRKYMDFSAFVGLKTHFCAAFVCPLGHWHNYGVWLAAGLSQLHGFLASSASKS